MLVKIETDAQVITTEVKPGGMFVVILNVRDQSVARLLSVPGESLEDFEANSALNGAYLGVGARGGFSVAPF